MNLKSVQFLDPEKGLLQMYFWSHTEAQNALNIVYGISGSDAENSSESRINICEEASLQTSVN